MGRMRRMGRIGPMSLMCPIRPIVDVGLQIPSAFE